ncbi:MAG: SDR family oxidoreductase [Faecalimonas sp.]|nr:SDR family oxidoreductase [Faecalimonas sp.]
MLKHNKYAVITGASSGIGAEFAKRLATEGYALVLVARREDRLKQLIESLNTECEMIVADLSKMSECERLVQQLEGKNIEVFINNAGFGSCGETLNIETETELHMIDVNVKSVHLLTKLILPQMVERDSGYILNVASSAGLVPAGPYMAAYYATKAYVTSYTRAVAEELKQKRSHVYIGCLCPGPVDTEFNKVANVEFALKGISAEKCANYAVTKMFRKEVTIIPGFVMKLATVASRLAPTSMAVSIAARQQRKKLYR